VRMGSDPDCPKPLMQAGGRPLLAHALRQTEAAGCDVAVVVVGFGAAAIRRFLDGFETHMRIEVAENHNYHDPNGTSLRAAEAVAAPRFFVQMADHVFDAAVLSRLEDGEEAPACRVLVDLDPSPANLNDPTTVRLEGRKVGSIGKKVAPFDAVDAGCFLLDRRVFAALRRAQALEPPTVSAAMRQLARRGELMASDLGATSWVDVDTPKDLALAERCLRGSPIPGGAG